MQRIVKCAPLDFQEATLLCIDMAPGERYTEATEFYAGKGKNTSAAPAPAAKTPAAKTPAAPAPSAKTPAAPAPSAKTPAAPAPSAKTPAAKTPAAPAPSAKTPAAPAPSAKTPAAPAAQPPAAKTTAAKTPAGKGAKDMLSNLKNSADSLGVTDMATGVLDTKKEEVKQRAVTEAGAKLNKAKDKVPVLEQSGSTEDAATEAPAADANEFAENAVDYAEEDWEEEWGEEDGGEDGGEDDGEYAEEEYKYVYYFY